MESNNFIFYNFINIDDKTHIDLIKYKTSLESLSDGTLAPNGPKQLMFVKVLNELKKYYKYKDTSELLEIIDSYNLHPVGSIFLKLKFIQIRLTFLEKEILKTKQNIKILSKEFVKVSHENESLQKNKVSKKKSIKSKSSPNKKGPHCLTCGKSYPIQRKNLGYNFCVNCSTVEKKTFIDRGFQTREGHKIMKSKAYRNSRKKH